jgi:hypothetical protein
VLVASVALEVVGLGERLPQNRRLVPPEITSYDRRDGSFQFGVEMGTGMRTFLPTALPFCLAITIVLIGSIPWGLTAGIGFALGRSLMPLVRQSRSDPRQWDEALVVRLRVVTMLSAASYAVASIGVFA